MANRAGARRTRISRALSRANSQKKVLRDVFAPGDAWMRSGDLMRKDTRGFSSRGSRWRNLSLEGGECRDVRGRPGAGVLPGVLEASVYGVEVAGHEGRAGMAALSVDQRFDLTALMRHIDGRLPVHAAFSP